MMWRSFKKIGYLKMVTILTISAVCFLLCFVVDGCGMGGTSQINSSLKSNQPQDTTSAMESEKVIDKGTFPIYSEINKTVWTITEENNFKYGEVIIQNNGISAVWQHPNIVFLNSKNEEHPVLDIGESISTEITEPDGFAYSTFVYTLPDFKRCFYQIEDSVFLAFSGWGQVELFNSYLVKVDFSKREVVAFHEYLKGELTTLYVQDDILYYFYSEYAERDGKVNHFLSKLDFDCNILETIAYTASFQTAQDIYVVTDITEKDDKLTINGYTEDKEKISFSIDY